MLRSVPRLDTRAFYSDHTGTRATGRIRLIEYPEMHNQNPYESRYLRPQVVLDLRCAAVKLMTQGKAGDRTATGYVDVKMYRCMVNRIDTPDLLRVGLFAVIDWKESVIKGVLDRIDPKSVSERFHLYIDAAQNVPFKPIELGA